MMCLLQLNHHRSSWSKPLPLPLAPRSEAAIAYESITICASRQANLADELSLSRTNQTQLDLPAKPSAHSDSPTSYLVLVSDSGCRCFHVNLNLLVDPRPVSGVC